MNRKLPVLIPQCHKSAFIILAIIIIFIYSDEHLSSVNYSIVSLFLDSYSSHYWQNFAKLIVRFSSVLTSPTQLNEPHEIF